MKFYIVDVFAEDKYQGNQLAVVVPDRELSDKEMRQIAAEINFSETTFILSDKQPNGGYDVRIFTPDIEVPFAGHPTLGTAYVIDKIIEGNKSAEGNVILNYKVGPIPVGVTGEGLVMSQNAPEWEDYRPRAEDIAPLFNISADDIDPDYPIESVGTGLARLMVPVKSIDVVKNFVTDKALFKKHHDETYRHNIMLFARDGENIYARVIMPDKDVCEDPATGSAAGDLAAYLLAHKYFGDKNHIKFTIKQGYEINRPSLLTVEATVDSDKWNITEKNGYFFYNKDMSDAKWDIKVGGKVSLVAQGEWM